MITLLGKFRRRPARDRRLLLRALVLHASVALLVRAVRFGWVTRRLRTRTAGAAAARRGVDGAVVARVVWAVRTAAAVAPWGRTCLTEALTAAALLRREGCDATLRYGVARDRARPLLAAHAWLEYRGEIIIGGATPLTYETLRPVRSMP